MDDLEFDEDAKTWAGALFETIYESDALGKYKDKFEAYKPNYAGDTGYTGPAEASPDGSGGGGGAESGGSADNTIDISGFTNPRTKNNHDLAAYAIQAWEHGWGYVWGTFGTVLTESMLQYKLEHGSDSLLDLCPDESLEVINPHRLNVVTDREKISYDPAEMDNAADQIKKIQELHLPVDELDACNLMAFFLGWAMKRGQMSNPFISGYREIVEAVQSGKEPDLRVFILDNLDGKLSTQFFDRRGSGFAQWYAQDNRSNPYIYRRDCRNIVLAESKDRVWNSIAEKEAAYLLLPYTEKNRQSVEHLLDERFQQYLEAEFADDPEERVARAAEGKPAVIPDWDGPLFCYASDRVAQDGCKVQIMDRLFPEREDMGWESGWAFYSGDEGDVYGEGDEYYESHCGFYDIRDICRIDPDIIPLLNLPYGTMQMRGEDGAWYEVIRDDEGEEET